MHPKESDNSTQNGNEIAVIGMAGRFPGAENIEKFWENLKGGVESISHFSDEELMEVGISPETLKNPDYIKAKGILEDVDCFDADFFGYPPREAERMDPQIRILHECSWEALERAGYNPESYDGLVGVYFGANENQEWIRRVETMVGHPSDGYDSFLLNYRDYVATRISNKLNLKGPSFTLLTACSTSLVAIHLACQALIRGECDMSIAGGVSLSLPQKSGYVYQEGLMVSADGHCRTFDARANGTVFGDGVGVVVLKPLRKALEDHDHLHAVVKGSAVNNDGNGKVGFTAPSIEGQEMVIRAALSAARVEPESIGYIETHGTGTKLGDPVEIEALKQAFDTNRRRFCGIGSLKTNIGHVNIAAGVSSFIKTVLSLEHGLIPPSLHCKKPNPEIDIKNSPFYVNTKLTKWSGNGTLRRAGVSAFGFGGTNAHVVLEEAPRQNSSRDSRPYQLLVVSAKTDTALNSMKKNLSEHLKHHPDVNLADVAYTLSIGRKDFKSRGMLVCRDVQEALRGIERTHTVNLQDQNDCSVVFMFPGQGSQYTNMAAELYQYEPLFRNHIDHCSEILKTYLDVDIREILYPRDKRIERAAEQLKQTTFAQPAIFMISYGLAKLWMAWGVEPKVMIGHSIGEYVAACLADVFSLEDALHIVAIRGQYMQGLPEGSMLVVHLSEEEVESYLKEDISLAAVNAPSLCVLSGPKDAIEKVEKELYVRSVDCHYLRTSHAFHSGMMEPILKPFAELIKQIEPKAPQIPILSTVTGERATAAGMAKPSYWTRNLHQTVRFSDGIQKLLKDSNNLFLEVGPGRTLSTLTNMHSDNRSILSSLRSVRESQSDEAFLLTTLGKLWLAGVRIDWTKFYEHEDRRRRVLPTYPFERQRFCTGLQENGRRRISRWDLLQKIPDIADWFHIPSWKRSVIPHSTLDRKTKKYRWLVFMDGCGLGSLIADRLKQYGQHVTAVYRGEQYIKRSRSEFVLNPGQHTDYDAMFNELSKMQKLPQKIVHLWSLTQNSREKLDYKRIDDAQNLGFYSLLFLAQVIGIQNITDEVHVLAVSNRIQDVTGNETIDAEKATILGPVKVIPQEYPNVRCCNVDVTFSEVGSVTEERMVDQILSEALSNYSDPIIAFRGNYRWVQCYEPVRLADSSRKNQSIRNGGVYMITGGLGGIGLVLAEFLGKTYRARLILTGRSVFPDRKDWGTWLRTHENNDKISQRIRKIKKIEKSGAEVLVITADVTDKSKMEAEISKAMEYFGTIHGVIHAAGVPGEGIIQLKKYEIAGEILAPKVKGTFTLDDILKDVHLDFFILCSSIASILGGIGLVDYCAANSFMDAFVCNNHSRKYGRVASINWDMWGEVGMGLKTNMPDELQAWLEKELRDGITSEEGIDVFRRILSFDGVSNVIVSTRDLQERIDLWIKREFIKEKETLIEEKASKPKYVRPNLSTDYTAPETNTEAKIAEIWGELFGIEKVGCRDNFYELGGHSLLATTLVNMLKKEFETNLSIRDVLDHPTVSELSEVIES